MNDARSKGSWNARAPNQSRNARKPHAVERQQGQHPKPSMMLMLIATRDDPAHQVDRGTPANGHDQERSVHAASLGATP
jgi:hypothetical protein